MLGISSVMLSVLETEFRVKTQTLSCALVQSNSGSDVSKNLEFIFQALNKASQGAAKLIIFPEVCLCRKQHRDDTLKLFDLDGPEISKIAQEAKRLAIWVLLGSVSERISESRKAYNSQILINPEGEIAAVYRKIHLFNVEVDGKKIWESVLFKAGEKPLIVDIEGFQVGLSICYDLRFPELYRYYASQGAEVLLVPASFTATTGEAHWELLLRARAVENQCYVLAPNQVGVGAQGVKTYGNSLAVDPWGRCMMRGSEDKTGIFFVELKKEILKDIREKLPVLKHRRSELFI